MSSIKMVALRKHPFGTGEREQGEEYEATADESAVLIALGWAEKAKEKKVEKSAPEKEAKAGDVSATKYLKADAPGKRGYQRRDMKAKS